MSIIAVGLCCQIFKTRLQRKVVEKVFVRANLQCEDKIETPYYSSNSFIDVCIHCGDPDNIVQEERDILPTCKFCLDNKPKVFRLREVRCNPLQTSKGGLHSALTPENIIFMLFPGVIELENIHFLYLHVLVQRSLIKNLINK